MHLAVARAALQTAPVQVGQVPLQISHLHLDQSSDPALLKVAEHIPKVA